MCSAERMSQLSITDSKVKWPLRFPFSYPISQRFNHLCNQSSHHKRYRRYLFTSIGKPLCYCKLTPELSAKEMGHKGKSMMRALYILRSNNEKINSVALAVIELCFPEGIRQAVIQPVEISIQYIILILWQPIGNI